MSERPAVIDDIDRHMDEAGSIDRATGPLGVYVAWCANLELLSETLVRDWAGEIVRLKMRDMRPGEFLIKVLAGTLSAEHLTDSGLAFTRRYYDVNYLNDYAHALELDRPHLYSLKDSWDNYDSVVPELTRRYFGSVGRRSGAHDHWWQRLGKRLGRDRAR